MTISVCMAVYNGELYIKEQLDSIFNQTLIPDELIIVDDCSSDNTKLIINGYFNKGIRIEVHENKNNIGVIKSFEKAIGKTNGDYVFLCDQDDIWSNRKVELMVDKLSHNKGLCISNYSIIDSLSNSSNINVIFDEKDFSILKTIVKNKFIGCSIGFHKNVKEKILPFPQHIPMHDSWIGIIALYYFNVSVLQENTLYYRRHSNNVTGKKQMLIKKLLDRCNLAFSLASRIINSKVA